MSAYSRKWRSRSPLARLIKAAFIGCFCLAFAVILLLPKAQANEIDNVHAILQIAQAFGEAVLDRDANGAQRITAEIDGFPYVMTFFDCDPPGTCSDLQLVAHFQAIASESQLYQWNAQTTGPRAYRDALGGTSIAHNIAIDAKLRPALVMELLGNWGNAVFDFVALINS